MPDFRAASALIYGLVGGLSLTVASTSAFAQLEEVTVTAQRRASDLQSTPVAVSAFTGAQLAEEGVFNVADLASSTPAFSITALSPLDLELNIRGIATTRLDSPTSDPSIGLFLDEVYIGRMGTLNTDFYDLERVEVIRGPQGVLLGKNVVGGALSVLTAKPEFDTSGKLTLSAGNYNSQLMSGFVTGGISERWAGRFSFQTRKHDGYAYDVLNDRDLEDLDSRQLRAQLLFRGDMMEARFTADFTKDETNGVNPVALRTKTTEGAWSVAREYFGLNDIRRSAPSPTYLAGERLPIYQFLDRESYGLMANIQVDFGGFSLSSITSYRDGYARNNYDQTGIGLGMTPTRADYNALIAADPRMALLSDSPVYETEDVKQYSQELRLTSNGDGRFDWIAGIYYKQDDVYKQDRFAASSILIPVLSGESLWQNDGEMKSYAAFAQGGWAFTDALKLSVGARYTVDKKSGFVTGLAVTTGDRFTPNDPIPSTPLSTVYRTGQGFATSYGEDWERFTPQAILSWDITDSFFSYLSVAQGFKGGGFDDTPQNDVAARIPFDPEKVTNYELGFKSDLLDRTLRLNLAAFYMDYSDLQVQQTNQACICLLTDNASNAEVKGLEVEVQYLLTERLMLWASGSILDAKYVDFIESTGLDSSGNNLQRTPERQYSVGIEVTAPFGSLGDALKFRTTYSHQSEMFWQPSNANREPGFGVVDAQVALAPPESPWRVAIWGKNLSDEEYRVSVNPIFGVELSQFAAPRTYGVDFSWQFGN